MNMYKSSDLYIFINIDSYSSNYVVRHEKNIANDELAGFLNIFYTEELLCIAISVYREQSLAGWDKRFLSI